LHIDHTDEPILDPVERERALLREQEASVGGTGVGGHGRAGVDSRDRGWSFGSKLAIALSLALIVGYLLLWARVVQESGGPEGYIRRPVDFISTLTGALIIYEGHGPLLYDLQTQHDAQRRIFAPYKALGDRELLPFNHLPFEALAVAPLMNMPYPLVFALWTLMAGLAIGLSLGVMDGALPGSRQVGWVLSMAACSYLPLVRALMLGQNSPLVLLGLCTTFAAWKWGRPGWAAVGLLLVALKPQVLPLVLLLMVLLHNWRALLAFAGLFIGLSVAITPALGLHWPMDYAQLLVGVAGWTDANAIDPAIMHNWRGFAANLVGGFAPGLVMPLYVLLALASMVVLGWAWLHHAVQAHEADTLEGAPPPDTRLDLMWALTTIVALLISPHLNPHDLSLLIFPAWVIGAHAAQGRWGGLSRLWVLLLWVGYALYPVTFVVSGLSGNAGLSVVPGVLLMAVAAGLLALQIGGYIGPIRQKAVYMQRGMP
jgi:hypothetical protein